MTGEPGLTLSLAVWLRLAQIYEGLAMNGELMRMSEVARFVGVSVTTWRRWWRAGQVPQPVNLLGKPRWLKSDVVEWLNSRCVVG